MKCCGGESDHELGNCGTKVLCILVGGEALRFCIQVKSVAKALTDNNDDGSFLLFII
jgi:hypothetical protein